MSVDTRVVQVIYEFAPSESPTFVLQEFDVFIAAPTREAATRNPTSGLAAFIAATDTRVRVAGGTRRPHIPSGKPPPSKGRHPVSHLGERIVLSLVLAALFFVGIHLGIAGTTIRDRAIGILGQNGYRAVFSVASVIGLAGS